jgi:lysophospholipase L1-like esterase
MNDFKMRSAPRLPGWLRSVGRGALRAAAIGTAIAVLAATTGLSAVRAAAGDGGAPDAAAVAPVPMPLISRGAPVYASASGAAAANGADYGTLFRGAIPAWVAYDLSRVPAAHRAAVVVAWFNDPMTYPYDHALVDEVAYNNPGAYTIDANAAAGGAAAPVSGWVSLARVAGNTKHSRQHRIDLTGYNWVRLTVTASDGSPQNADAAFKLDVHDASGGVLDDWIFFGDSITANTMHHGPVSGGKVANLSQLVNAARPDYFPLVEEAGIGGVKAATGAAHIAEWLALFPGHFVALAYGTNDAGGGCDRGSVGAFRKDYAAMIAAVVAAGRVPVVPTIPWANSDAIRRCGPEYNDQIRALYKEYPQLVRGPDLWTFFESNPALISNDNLHPSEAGNAAYRQQWRDTLLKSVYRGAP